MLIQTWFSRKRSVTHVTGLWLLFWVCCFMNILTWCYCKQEYGFSPLCVRLCLSKFDVREKEESHISQEYGISPLCVRLCLSKFDVREKEESHISQEYVFYPVCVRLCSIQIWFLGKGGVTYFTGIWHSILCVFAYVYPKLIFGKRRSHIFHRNMASILCVLAYAYPKLIFGKRRSHIFHRNMASILCVLAYAYPKLIFGKRKSPIFHRNMSSILCVLAYAYPKLILGKGGVSYFTGIWLLSSVC